MISPFFASASKIALQGASTIFNTASTAPPLFPGLTNVVDESSKALDAVLRTTKHALVPHTLHSSDQTFFWLRLELVPWIVSLLSITIPSALAGNFELVLAWLCAEITFMIVCASKYPDMNKISKAGPTGPGHFLKLWHECFASLSNGREWLRGWFFNANFDDISREDVISWLSWAIFGASEDSLGNSDRVKVLRLIALLQDRLEHAFPRRQAGREPLKCMRFSIEPLQYFPKPLLFYSACSALGAVGDVTLQQLGFRRMTGGPLNYMVRMPPGPRDPSRAPIVFVHGVGIGLVTYLRLLTELAAWGAPVIAVELPYVSMRVDSLPPSIEEHVASVTGVLDELGLGRAHLIGHSYGSLLLSWMVKHAPERVAGAAFVDPVTFMLHLPDVLRSFLYKKGATPGIHVSDLVGSELFLNRALRRHFVWHRNIIFCSELQERGIPTLVALSEADEIVPSREVARHVREHQRRAGAAGVVDVYVMGGAAHGQVLFDQSLHEGLARRLRRHWAGIHAADDEPAAAAAAPAAAPASAPGLRGGLRLARAQY